jgi:hypothetical protein
MVLVYHLRKHQAMVSEEVQKQACDALAARLAGLRMVSLLERQADCCAACVSIEQIVGDCGMAFVCSQVLRLVAPTVLWL